MKSFLGNFYSHLAFFSGHTGQGVSCVGLLWVPTYLSVVYNTREYVSMCDCVRDSVCGGLIRIEYSVTRWGYV